MRREVTVDQLCLCLFTNRAQLPADTSIFQRSWKQSASEKCNFLYMPMASYGSNATGTVVFFTTSLSKSKMVVLSFLFH